MEEKAYGKFNACFVNKVPGPGSHCFTCCRSIDRHDFVIGTEAKTCKSGYLDSGLCNQWA